MLHALLTRYIIIPIISKQSQRIYRILKITITILIHDTYLILAEELVDYCCVVAVGEAYAFVELDFDEGEVV